jgi:hypothetical protein
LQSYLLLAIVTGETLEEGMASSGKKRELCRGVGWDPLEDVEIGELLKVVVWRAFGLDDLLVVEEDGFRVGTEIGDSWLGKKRKGDQLSESTSTGSRYEDGHTGDIVAVAEWKGAGCRQLFNRTNEEGRKTTHPE